MEPTTEILSRFVGGQLEIQNQGEGYLFRGEVESVKVEDGGVKVRFAWLAKGEGYPPLPERWVSDDNLDYGASLEITRATDMDDGRMRLEIPIVGEIAVFFPPDGSKLDPTKVEGLVLA